MNIPRLVSRSCSAKRTWGQESIGGTRGLIAEVTA